MPFQIFFKLDRGETLLPRMKRARGEGYLCALLERGCTLAVGRLQCEHAPDWLDNVIEEGLEEPNDEHASGREVEAEYVLPD